MIEHMNCINALASQIYALLDLIQCCNEECIDVGSIKLAAEMCVTMQDELMAEVGKIEDKYAMLSTSASEG